MTASSPSAYTVVPVTGVGEVRRGDDLAAVLGAAVELRDGDVLVVTSKVVSKAEGRVVTGTKEEAVAAETVSVVARRGGTSIVRHRTGLVMAAAGVDASNTAPGTLVLLPLDPDASARALRERLHQLSGRNVAVVVTDTFGRAWRNGQTDVAIGVAGIEPLEDHAGRVDAYGNDLVVTAPAVADELAGAAELAQGKTTGVPAAVVRGLDRRVLPPGEHGPGAVVLVRPQHQDMFALGTREAVLTATAAPSGASASVFGTPASAEELVAAFALLGLPGHLERGEVLVPLPAGSREAGRAEARLEVVARAHGWSRSAADARPGTAVFQGATP